MYYVLFMIPRTGKVGISECGTFNTLDGAIEQSEFMNRQWRDVEAATGNSTNHFRYFPVHKSELDQYGLNQ